MVLSAREKREIKKAAEERAKEEKKARERAERKHNRSTSSSRTRQNGMPGGPARLARVTNIYQPNYGDTVTITGHGNQVAVGNEGDVAQEIAQQDVSTQPVDLDTTLAAVRDLLHHLQHDGIRIEDEKLTAELRSEAADLQAEADTEEPDQGRMRRLAASIGEKLATIPLNALGGFSAQLLATAFLPPVS